jgi:hypothetical protein
MGGYDDGHILLKVPMMILLQISLFSVKLRRLAPY